MANDFKKYPYQDFNAFNLDWIIERTKEIDVVDETAKKALVKATEARNLASAAANTANTANNTANAAYTLAENANTAAGTAQSRADSAYTLADSANTAAGTAQSRADSAASAASAAQTRADNAYTLADNANTAAGNAQSTANSAAGAASAAQTRADNAYTLADNANTAINNLRSNGTWTPTMPRANINSASGKWYVIGDVCFLSAKITFSSSQTDKGDLYIEESSLPSVARGKAISGAGAGSLNYVAACTDTNNNLWLSRGNRVKATDVSLAGSTVLFSLTAVPK